MTQEEIIKYFNENGGLCCKYWTLKEIKQYIKDTFGKEQKVYESTCEELKRTAQMFQL